MRLLCRLNYHLWGMWSRPWFRRQDTVDRAGNVTSTTYNIYRTLRCRSCGHERSEHVDRLSGLGDPHHYKIKPEWEE